MSTASTNLAAAIQSLTEAMRQAMASPADAIRILLGMLATPPSLLPPGSSVMQDSITAVFRRSALASIAVAASQYQPTSLTDAQAKVAQLSAAFDTEATLAADALQQADYEALRQMRTYVINDLLTRSASLPELITVTLPGAQPSLVLAYRLYQDTTREPDLVARANPVHPGFMPPAFEALAF